MIRDYVLKKLNKLLSEKKHDCLKLEWQKAELQHKMMMKKKQVLH